MSEKFRQDSLKPQIIEVLVRPEVAEDARNVNDPAQKEHGGPKGRDSERVEHGSGLLGGGWQMLRCHQGGDKVVAEQHIGGRQYNKQHHGPEARQQLTDFTPLGDAKCGGVHRLAILRESAVDVDLQGLIDR